MDKKQVRPELCPFEVPFLDDFDLDVDELVISVYKSTIDGIDRLDKKRSAELKAEEDEEAHPRDDLHLGVFSSKNEIPRGKYGSRFAAFPFR